MACGCKKKKKSQPVENQPSVDYRANGNGTVALGLTAAIRLPVRIPKAIDGRDVVIVANKLKRPPVPNAVFIVGRNAQVDPRDRQQLVDKWPKAFA